MLRIFDNPNNLSQEVVDQRFKDVDRLSECVVYSYDESGYPIHYYVAINTILTEEEINLLLSYPYNPLTTDKNLAKKLATHDLVESIPDWATWTWLNWATWYNANISDTQINAVTTLAEAKVILKKMSAVEDKLAKLVIALRDNNWPNLE